MRNLAAAFAATSKRVFLGESIDEVLGASSAMADGRWETSDSPPPL